MFLRKALVALLFCSLHFAAYSQEKTITQVSPGPEKVALIKELWNITGAFNISNQIMGNIVDVFKKNNPTVAPSVWESMKQKMRAEELMDSLIVVYDKHFTVEELQALLAFYKTPTGMKMIKEMPSIAQESFAIGQEWGRRKAIEIDEELKAEAKSKKSK